MAYRDDISALSPEHHWVFDGNSNDIIGTVNGTDTGISYAASAIAEDATNCAQTNALTDRVALPTTTDINNSAQARKAVAGWFRTTAIQAPPTRIYGEGTQTTCFQFCLGFGNNVMFEVTEPTNFPTGIQIYGPVLQPNRVYHLCGIFLGNANGNEVKFFVDGIEQTNADPSDRQPDTADLNSRGVGEFGDPSGTTGVGAEVVLQQAARNGEYNHWASWGDTANADLTDTEIREELFEKGALPDITITSGTESAMQATLDTYASTERADAPLCIRVPANTGDTDFTLTADDITFDPLASIHVQYTGTSTLTWRNSNGASASIFSTTNGGTIVVENEVSVTFTGLQNPTEIRLFEVGTTNEVAGQENVTTGSVTFDIFNSSVDVMIVSLGEEIIRLEGVDTSTDVSLQITQFLDRNYENN